MGERHHHQFASRALEVSLVAAKIDNNLPLNPYH